jgi:hypothetical protein
MERQSIWSVYELWHDQNLILFVIHDLFYPIIRQAHSRTFCLLKLKKTLYLYMAFFK